MKNILIHIYKILITYALFLISFIYQFSIIIISLITFGVLELYFNVIANFIIFSIVPLMILFGKKLILKPIFEVEKIDPIVIKHITRIDVLLNKNKSNTKTSDTLAEKNGLLSLQDPKETGGELSKSDEEGKLSKDN